MDFVVEHAGAIHASKPKGVAGKVEVLGDLTSFNEE
jgi:hypothetical protein